MAYQILSEGVTWATVFREMESNRERLGVVDYSVSQTTLEQVQLFGVMYSSLGIDKIC